MASPLLYNQHKGKSKKDPGDQLELRDYLFGSFTRQSVYKSLDAGAMRNRAIAQNIANISTPDYKRKEVSFEAELRKVLEIKLKATTTNERHMEITQNAELQKINAYSYVPNDPTLPGEINNVDIDIENAKLAENQILYNFAMKFAGFSKINAAITGNPAP